MIGPECFLFELTKKFSLKNGEKIEGRKRDCLMDKNAYIQFIYLFIFFLLGMWPLYLFFFFSFFLFWIFFFHFLIS